jgi:hypothetical protein
MIHKREIKMKKIAMVTALLCVSGSALAADFGLGVSIRSNDSTIYVPIDVSKSFRIEPMLRYQNSKSESSVFGAGSPYTVAATAELTSWNVGVGVFGVTQVAESANVYYGGRIGYISADYETSYAGTAPPGVSFLPSKDKSDGFFLAPTIGVEYRFSDHFSIGGEAALIYTKVDGDQYTDESTSTSTNIIFRYMF